MSKSMTGEEAWGVLISMPCLFSQLVCKSICRPKEGAHAAEVEKPMKCTCG